MQTSLRTASCKLPLEASTDRSKTEYGFPSMVVTLAPASCAATRALGKPMHEAFAPAETDNVSTSRSSRLTLLHAATVSAQQHRHVLGGGIEATLHRCCAWFVVLNIGNWSDWVCDGQGDLSHQPARRGRRQQRPMASA